MSTIASTIAINSAFLQEIKADRQELEEVLGRLRSLLGVPKWWLVCHKTCLHLLSQLRDQLALHFALENFFGYCDVALEVEPRLSEKAVLLRDEHEALYLESCALVEEAERVCYGEAAKTALRKVGMRFLAFDLELQRHERAEQTLLLEAFDQDLGVGD